MAIKRYTAIADNTITNQYSEGLSTRTTSANTGLADSLEIFKIYGQVTATTVEQSRILIKFPVNETDLPSSIKTIKQDRDTGILPASGSVKFIMKLGDVVHADTVPNNFKIVAHPLTKVWQEGLGIDLDEYSDIGHSNWLSASSTTAWSTAGGDFNSTAPYLFEQEFTTGFENIEVDISKYVEDVLDSSLNSGVNYGLILLLSSSYLADSNSYYTKKFSARSSEYFFNRPVIEARWDSSIKDDRSNFYYSSSLAQAADNLNTLYLYNNIGGRLQNIPGDPSNVYVQLYLSSGSATSGSALTLVTAGGVAGAAPTIITGSKVSTGIYNASVAMTGTADTLHDVWYNGSSTQYHTGTIYPEQRTLEGTTRTNDYYVSITNLKQKYNIEETARFRVYTRLKGWSPTIYTRAVSEPQLYIPTSGSYEIFRIIDNYDVIKHATGSINYTELSFDGSGSYFDFDMSILEPGYSYGIKLAFYDDFISDYKPVNKVFKFRVEKHET
tara:strand:+ start:4961 stop:6454 length:1494 start_codon:yes stop_codon:yes gene_type:complete